jgi:uncharacterized membrane protein YhaH (DUF805 family)
MNQFVAAFKDVLSNYANFKDRVDRGTFWRFVGVVLIVEWLLAILAYSVSTFFGIPYFLFVIVVFVPQIAVCVRRLHDTGKTGWLLLLGLIPLVGAIILIVFFVQAGDPAPNAYGPPHTPLVA